MDKQQAMDEIEVDDYGEEGVIRYEIYQAICAPLLNSPVRVQVRFNVDRYLGIQDALWETIEEIAREVE